ncbi:hypothetical protein [Streptomyces sp. NBC_00645]|uniref:hypothetical protein n=1 Tax=Streptomyces sp. NBC_00645 TaxID=2975795 RepID=UPI0038679430
MGGRKNRPEALPPAPPAYRWTALEGVGFAPVRTADGSTDAEVGVADGGGPVRVGERVGSVGERVGSVEPGAALGAEVRSEPRGALGRGLTRPGDTDGVGSADGLLADGGASGTTGDTGDSGAADRSGSATRAPTAQARPAPAAARSSRRRAAPRRIAS